MATELIGLLTTHHAKVFAAVIPRLKKPLTNQSEMLRKDLVFLFEWYFYFLEGEKETGLLVMDGSEKQADRKLVRRMERYFTLSEIGRQRTQWIVPVPFFVESDMAYGVQAADLCIYCLNWGWRLREMTEPTRLEIQPFARQLAKLIWRGDGYRDGRAFQTHGTVYVPDPYSSR
jgi:hypothetical protein